jgi:hypothetical protein
MNRLPAEGTKDRKKMEAMLSLGSPHGVEKRELQEIDSNGGWGTYRNDGKRYADFLGGTLRVWGEGKSERYWIELPPQSKWRNYFGLTDVMAERIA